MKAASPHRLDLILCAIFLLAQFATAQTTNQTQYYFTTFAGTSSIGSTDGVGSGPRFNTPLGCAADGAGNTYVADTFNHTIRKVSSTGVTTTLAGKPGVSGADDGTGSAARFNRPTGIAVDSTGTVFVLDSDSRKIRKISPAGVVTTVAATLNGAPNPGRGYAINAVGLALDVAGNLYTADSAEYIVQKITPSGIVTTVAGIAGQQGGVDGPVSVAQLNPTGGIAIDGSGVIYLTEPNSIRKITPGGDVSILAGGNNEATTTASFNSPKGVTVDSGGNLFVADSNNNVIRKINPSGIVTTFAGNPAKSGDADGTGTDATFFGPAGIALDSAGNLMVVDSSNNTLRRISPAGQVATLAGLSPDKCKGNVDGPGGNARFNGPAGMTISSAGDIYIADSGNHTIRKIAPSGVVTTVAGVAGQSGYLDGPVTAALFSSPNCLAIDRSANLIVSDYGNACIRKISPAGIVTTVASQPLLDRIQGLAVDGPGNIYVTEKRAFQKIDPAGTVSTFGLTNSVENIFDSVVFDSVGNLYWSDPDESVLDQLPVASIGTNALPTQARFTSGNAVGAIFVDGKGQIFGTDVPYFGDSRVFAAKMDGSIEAIGGQLYAWGNTDGVGTAALFNGTRGVVADHAGNIYVSCFYDNTIRRGVPAGAPVITTQPQNVTVAANNGVQFSVAAGGVPEPTYQWYFNGAAVSGATGGTLSFANARSTDAGDYTVVVTNELGSVTSNKATLTVSSSPTSTTPSSATPTDSGGGGSFKAWFVMALFAIAGASRSFRRCCRPCA